MNTTRATEIASAIAAAIAQATGVNVNTVNTAAIVAAIAGPEPMRPYAGEDSVGMATAVDGKVVYSG